MATSTATSTKSLIESLTKVKEDLTCSVCLDIYTDPKSLPCLHAFCHKCLDDLPKEKKPTGKRDLQCECDTFQHYITCPTCRRQEELPAEGVDCFPKAYYLNNLRDVYNLLKKIADPQQVTCDNCDDGNAEVVGCCKDCNKLLCQKCIDMHKNWKDFRDHVIKDLDNVRVDSTHQLFSAAKIYCSKLNHTKSLKYYCATCDEAICGECVLLGHASHKYDLIANCFDEHRASINNEVYSVSRRVESIQSSLVEFKKNEKTIVEKGEEVKTEIRAIVAEMMRLIRESEERLIGEVDAVTAAKQQVLKEQVELVKADLNTVKKCESYVKDSLNLATQQQIMLHKKQMMERMSQVLEQVEVRKINSVVIANLQLVKDDNVLKSLKHIGDNVLYSSTAVSDCKVKLISCIEHLPETKIAFQLSIEALDLSLLSVKVSSLQCSLTPAGKDDPIPTTIAATTHPGVYRILCKTSTRGTHTVKVQVHDVQLEDTSLVISFNPYSDKIHPVRIIPNLNGLWGVAVASDGNILVTENNCVTVLDPEGTENKSFGKEVGGVRFTNPRGIAITPDNFILVTDSDEIKKINMDGELLLAKNSYYFRTPEGIAISLQTGRIYFANRYQHEVQILDPDLSPVGTQDGYISYPHDVAIDDEGILYVVDEGNNRIRKFLSDGKFLAEFGSLGDGPGEFKWAQCITIDTTGTGLVYVTDLGNNRISVFKKDGQFIRCFGGLGSCENEFKKPIGITFDKEGFLYVCDSGNDRLVVY